MNMLALVVLSIVMAIIHISIWFAIPKGLRDFIFANPFLAFLADIAGSSLITTFAGISAMVGIPNLIGSLLFVLFVIAYNIHFGIKGLGVAYVLLFNKVPVFPYFKVIYVIDKDKEEEIK